MAAQDTFLFVWRRPPPPLFIGGAEITQNSLAVELARNGSKVIYVGSLEDPRYPTKEREDYYLKSLNEDSDVQNLQESKAGISYQFSGIECLAVPQNKMDNILKVLGFKYPESYLISSQEGSEAIISRAKSMGLKTIGWLHSSSETGLEVLKAKPDHTLSTSKYIADVALKKYNYNSSVFYPTFIQEFSRIEHEKGFITFINPVPEKGADLFLEIAKSLPKRNFLAVEGWYKNHQFIENMPSNVSYLSPQSNMSNVWNRTRVLLVPSKVDEAFGRVVVEAGLAGIPSIVSSRGGLSEALNGSGQICDSNNIEAWISAIEALDDQDDYSEASKKAASAMKLFTRNSYVEFKNIINPSRPPSQILRPI